MIRRLVLVLLCIGPAAFAQNPIDQQFERVLVPIVYSFTGEIRGAYGSVWEVGIVGSNDGDNDVVATSYPLPAGCTQPPCTQGIPGHSTIPLVAYAPDPGAGAFLFIDRTGAADVTLSLRIRDTSRALETWGTSIPIVRERDVATSRLELLDVPTESQFRSALRVYDFDDAADRSVSVKIYSKSGTTPLVEAVMQLRQLTDSEANLQLVGRPGRFAINDIVAFFPQLAAVPRVRIEVTPVTPGLRFWAFVSTTHNTTQHVTLTLPDFH